MTHKFLMLASACVTGTSTTRFRNIDCFFADCDLNNLMNCVNIVRECKMRYMSSDAISVYVHPMDNTGESMVLN
jgi:hypothetical protein